MRAPAGSNTFPWMAPVAESCPVSCSGRLSEIATRLKSRRDSVHVPNMRSPLTARCNSEGDPARVNRTLGRRSVAEEDRRANPLGCAAGKLLRDRRNPTLYNIGGKGDSVIPRRPFRESSRSGDGHSSSHTLLSSFCAERPRSCDPTSGLIGEKSTSCRKSGMLNFLVCSQLT
jgi:hypothetical protein